MGIEFSTALSIAALCVSFYTLWKQRKRLKVVFDDNYIQFNPKEQLWLEENRYYIPCEKGILVGFSLINPGQTPMSVFDLVVISKKQQCKLPFILKHFIPETYKNKELKITASDDKAYSPEIPDRPSQLVRPGEYFRIDLVICPEYLDSDDTLLVSMKVTSTSFFHRSKIYPNGNKRIYEAHEKIYKLMV